MYTTMQGYEMEKRQNGHTTILPNGDVYGNDGTNGNDIPTYVWAIVVIFLAFAVICGVCARRNYRRRYIYSEEILANRPPTILPFTRVGRPAVFDPNAAGGGILRPPRAHRRPSQASVTSLPLYNENPGEREVVLLQRTGPKEDERHSTTSPPPPASPTQPTVPVGTYPPPPSAPLPPTVTNSESHSQPRPSEPTASNQPLEPPGLERAASAPNTDAPTTTAPGASDPLGRRSPPPAWSSTNPFTQPESR